MDHGGALVDTTQTFNVGLHIYGSETHEGTKNISYHATYIS